MSAFELKGGIGTASVVVPRFRIRLQLSGIIAAQAAGSATGLENGNPQFTGLDGVTVRIDGAYSAGTRTIDSLNGD